jgi:hypothetical protein
MVPDLVFLSGIMVKDAAARPAAPCPARPKLSLANTMVVFRKHTKAPAGDRGFR